MPSNSTDRWLRRSTALSIALAVLMGCHSAPYRAANLPAELRMAGHNASKKINLASIASPGTGTATLAPGDLLEITITTGRDEEDNTPIIARIADDGTVDVPIIGPVPVAGMEAFTASQNIVNLAIQRGIYRHPLVTVDVKKKAIYRVTVLGAVQEPGVYELPRGNSDLVGALAAAGGLDDKASSKVEIIKQPRYGIALQKKHLLPNNEDEEIQLAAYQNLGHQKVQQAKKSQSPTWLPSQTLLLDLAKDSSQLSHTDYRINDRDIVRVIPLKNEVIHVTGLVNTPGQFELPLDQEIHLLDAIAMAGGRSSPVADKIFVIRHPKNHLEPVVIQASLAKAKQNGRENLLLGAGDTISVEQTPSTAIVDTISRFFRLSFGVASNTVF